MFQLAPFDKTPHQVNEVVNKDHGRLETRYCYVFNALECLPQPDHATLKPAGKFEKIVYPKPDGKLSSVFLSSTNHVGPTLPLEARRPRAADPRQPARVRRAGKPLLYCPAGAYKMVEDDESKPRFQINIQNCVHCKTCNVQNITWVAPEGGGGPNYPSM